MQSSAIGPCPSHCTYLGPYKKWGVAWPSTHMCRRRYRPKCHTDVHAYDGCKFLCSETPNNTRTLLEPVQWAQRLLCLHVQRQIGALLCGSASYQLGIITSGAALQFAMRGYLIRSFHPLHMMVAAYTPTCVQRAKECDPIPKCRGHQQTMCVPGSRGMAGCGAAHAANMHSMATYPITSPG